jgi:DNA-binding transcriptional LysR family regulator
MVLRQLEYLCALADSRHFGRAADACHVSQPALSVAIRNLESELGIELVHRGRGRVDLTPAGQELVTRAREVLESSRTFTTEASRLKRDLTGTLRIGVIPTALPVIADIVSPLLAEHPSIDLQLRSLAAVDIADQIATFTVDVGITYLDDQPGDRMTATPIFSERHLLLTTADEPTGSTISWRDLDGMPLCLLTTEMQNRQLVDAALSRAGAEAKVRIETDSITGLFSFARQGWSSIVSDAWLTLYGVPPGMRALNLVDPEMSYPIGIVTRRSEHPPPLVTALLRSVAVPSAQEGGGVR